MIYPATFEQKIGFDRLREQVAARCTMRAARERLAAEGFSTSAREIERRLALADEMRLLLDMEHDFPGGEYPDVDYIVAKLRVEGSFLDVEEVVTLRRALAAIGGIVSFIISREERYPALHARTRGVAAFPEIVQRIDGILDRFGQVKDNASPALQEIRRSIREREGQAAKRLQAVLSAAKGAGIVDADAQISIRDGKAVIPVSAGNKRKLNGFIHDESATGKTFYVEPVEVVEINNELRELEYAERREVVRILTEFTEAIRPDAGLIADSGDYLAEIDMLRAKGRWASENGCVRPILSTDDRLVLKNARHPLLQQTLRAAGREIVPLDLQLDRRKRILVISGPNAGGKSVCLKTTGIVQYMFQCGFPVPVSEVSELPVFESIFIDIGDEQSIDNDLSTYSSHLLNMKHMLAGASGRTLVLIDEFGSGTEPVIGGAIAEAILERVLRRDHDPLRQYQVLRRVGGGHRQRRDDVRRAEHPAAVPAGNGQAGQFVRRGDRPQDRASGGYYPCGEREGRVGSHQYRETAARDRPRQALLGAEARPHPSDGPQGRGVGAELCRAAGEDPRRAAGDSEKGQAGGPAVDRRRQQTDRKYD